MTYKTAWCHTCKRFVPSEFVDQETGRWVCPHRGCNAVSDSTPRKQRSLTNKWLRAKHKRLDADLGGKMSFKQWARKYGADAVKEAAPFDRGLTDHVRRLTGV